MESEKRCRFRYGLIGESFFQRNRGRLGPGGVLLDPSDHLIIDIRRPIGAVTPSEYQNSSGDFCHALKVPVYDEHESWD
jgi:hypothetical protein